MSGHLIFTEDLIPEFILIVLALITLILCIYSAVKYKDLPAAGYIVPLVYSIWMYSYFAVTSPIAEEREFFSRLLVIMMLIDISIWRVVEILKDKKISGEDTNLIHIARDGTKKLLNKIVSHIKR